MILNIGPYEINTDGMSLDDVFTVQEAYNIADENGRRGMEILARASSKLVTRESGTLLTFNRAQEEKDPEPPQAA